MLSRFRKSLTGAAILSALAVFSIPAAQPASAPESKDPIIIGKLDWVGQEITAEVAGEILRRMGYNVQFLQTTIVPMFQAVADGQMTVYLEQWNQSSKKYYDDYIKNARIEDLGETGLTGAEGWYYPEYVEQKCPGLPEWTALKKCAGIFATPDTAPKGRFLDYPAEYTPDSPEWIKALGLDFVPVPSGGEGSTAAEVKSAVARKEPLIIMWWEPTWLVSGYKMKRVQLDAAGEACKLAQTAGIKTHESFNCPGNKVQIVKIAWPGLKDKWPTAYKFLKAYQISNEQQGPMGMAVAAEGKKASDVAKKWVDANEAVWKPWVDKATH